MQSYLLLQPAPPDPTLIALEFISAQLHSFTTTGQFVNATTTAQFTTQSVPLASPPPLWAIWLNITWFSGLILSLSSAVIGITVKQWINEYLHGISGAPRELARLRQYRLNGLIKWRVAAIVALLPILLQLALAMFLIGLLVLLWSLHTAVASVASVLVGLLASFSIGTTILPLLQSDCAYLSPLSLSAFFLWEQIKITPQWVKYWLLEGCTLVLQWLMKRQFIARRPNLWDRLDMAVFHLALPFLDPPTPVQSWRGREQFIVAMSSAGLDADLVSTAYTTTMDPERLSGTASCLSDLPQELILDCFDAFYVENKRHWGASVSDTFWPQPSKPGPIWADGIFACLWSVRIPQINIHKAVSSTCTWLYRSQSMSHARWNIRDREWILAALARALLVSHEHPFKIENFIATKSLLQGALESHVSLGESVRSGGWASLHV